MCTQLGLVGVKGQSLVRSNFVVTPLIANHRCYSLHASAAHKVGSQDKQACHNRLWGLLKS